LNKSAVYRFLLLGMLAGAGIALWSYLPSELAVVATWPERARALGVGGPLAMAAICIPSAVLMVPASWITLLGSFTFGISRSLVPLSVGHLLGSCAAFLVGRYLARSWVERQLAGNARLAAIDRAVAEQGFKIVLLSRLSPLLPFGVLSYSFGLTNISFRRYALATWLGMSPGTLLYVYLGAAAKEVGDVFSGRAVDGGAPRVLFFVGLAATLAVTIVITRIANAALCEAVREPR
jgi:uncharacterized membrane protein YdjX (TVP38/TMEM64 family)